jgi:CrcB protein
MKRPQLGVLAAIALGGVAGALARYGLSAAWPTGSGRFPWITFVINVTGSAALGCLLTFIVERLPRDRLARPLLCTGLLGAYTTYSTFAVEAVLLGKDGHAVAGIAYVLTSVGAGLAAVVFGVAVARGLLRAERRFSEGRA